jgi:KDO2-lipid IV(A) lauroyltransferase
MSEKNIFSSELSVQISILIGKYLPHQVGYKISQQIAKFIANRKNLEMNKAIRLNQYVANDMQLDHHGLVDKCLQVLTHSGKCFVDLYQVYDKPDLLDTMVPLTQSMKEFIDLSHQNQGYMVVAPHLSNFDLVVSSLVRHGFKGKVLSYPNPNSGYQLQNQIRESLGMELLPLGDSRLESIIINHLKNGGVAATGVDRPVPGRKERHFVKFFDRPSPVPVGYITTALAAEVPIIVVTAIMEPNGTYGFKYKGPIELKKYKSKIDNIKLNAEMILKEIEEFIRLAPEQWLMYYPVWPDLIKENL